MIKKMLNDMFGPQKLPEGAPEAQQSHRRQKTAAFEMPNKKTEPLDDDSELPLISCNFDTFIPVIQSDLDATGIDPKSIVSKKMDVKHLV